MSEHFHKKLKYKIFAGLMAALMIVMIVMAWQTEGAEKIYPAAAIGATAGAVLIMMLLGPKKKAKGVKRIPGIILNLGTIVLSPLLAVWLLQNFTLDPFRIYPVMLLVNCIFYYLFYLLLSFLFGSFHVGYLIADWIFLLIGVANFFVVEFRGSPIMPWDLMSLGTAASVANNYTYSITWRFVFSAFGFLYLIMLAMKLTWRPRHIAVRIIGTAACALSLFLVGYTLQDSEFKAQIGMDTTLFTPNVRYRNNGFLAAFVGNLHLINIEKPDGYSVEKVEELQSEIASEHEEENANQTTQLSSTSPNIIVIMDEAFSDLAVLGDFETDKDYMPNFRKLMEECVGGHLMVSVKGGNTANTEYEFLSGDTMAFLPEGSVVYQQYIHDAVPALPSYLASLGYTTTAIHPYLPTGWDRDTVYPLLGFQDFLSQYDFSEPKILRQYISDESAFEKIEEVYEQKNAQSDDPAFIFEVTMQNHSGYSKEYAGFSEEIHLQNLGYTNIQTRAVNKYLTLVYETDKALGNLISYFENVDEPTIIVMFGDHEPSDYITDVIERYTEYDSEASIEEAQKEYLVPYFIWNNFGMEIEDRDLTSVNYLAANILEAAGIPLTQYQEFLLDLQKQVPVICKGTYIDADGTYHSWSEKNDDSTYGEILNNYNILEYNHLTDHSNRVTSLFSVPASRAG